MSTAMQSGSRGAAQRAADSRRHHAPTNRADLQGLRAIAVLGVVVYHLRAGWLPGGFAGVDVFFVLSGFFITGLLLREADRTGSIALSAFWARRTRRLLPSATLVIVLTMVAGYLITNAIDAQRLARDGLYATAFAMNWHEAAGGLAYGQDPHPSPLQHFWSLGVEEQFYLGWPVLVLALTLLAHRRAGAGVRPSLVAIAGAAAIWSFTVAAHQTGHDQPHAYYATYGRVWQLALGGLLAAAIGRATRLPRWLRRASRALGVVVIVGFYVSAPAGIAYPGWYSLVPAAGAALVVAAVDAPAGRDPVARALNSPLAQAGGRYSYSWYLWHWPPLVLVPIALGRPLRAGELVCCAAATLLAAVLTHHLLENPVRSSRWLTTARGGR